MLREIAAGVAIGLTCLGLPLACGSELPALVRCKLDALRVLPDDPGMATAYDAVDVIERIGACRHAFGDGDAGSP